VSDATLPQEVEQEMLARLRRIEGQARGVQRMVEDGRDCTEVIHQLASIRAAVHSASLFLLKHYARECWTGAGAGDRGGKPLEELIELMFKASP
jgi:DNA-binding FrmR family transcriptional regulator